MENQNVILKEDDVNAVKAAVEKYKTTSQDLFNKLESSINTLTSAGAGFNGDASVGYIEFFQQIRPLLTTKLNSENESVMATVSQLIDGIKETLLNQVDPDLGKKNKNAGVSTTETAAE